MLFIEDAQDVQEKKRHVMMVCSALSKAVSKGLVVLTDDQYQYVPFMKGQSQCSPEIFCAGPETATRMKLAQSTFLVCCKCIQFVKCRHVYSYLLSGHRLTVIYALII